MIQFDDLLAARLLDRLLPERRATILSTLDEMVASTDQRGLLSRLLTGETISMDQARHVHGLCEQAKRARVTTLYARYLASKGVAGPPLHQLLERLGAAADVNALGDAVVAAGLIAAEHERTLRFQLRVVSDRDQADEVQRFLASRPGSAAGPPAAGPPAAGPAAAAPPARETISSRIKLSALDVRAPSAAELTAPPQGMMSSGISQEEGFRPPAFPVPDWIKTSDPRTGKRIHEYRVLGRIGAGAMGIVYLADHLGDPSRPVALKVLNEEAEDEARGRFKREILANSMFTHPGVIDIYDAGRTPEGEDYLAMEFFDGEDLAQILETETKLEPRRAIDLSRQMFETLAAAHDAGIVHRDLKPANILVSRDGATARLMDFGVAIIRDLGEFEGQVFRTIEGGATGTPEFMSPEQAAGDAVLLAPSDLYSMGLVLYMTLSGRLPFESESSSGYMACHMMEDPLPLAKALPALKSLPKELHELLASLFDKNPANRPASAAVVAATLTRILTQVSTEKAAPSRGLWGLLWGERKG